MNQESHKLEANFNTLVISIASSAMMALGLAPHPNSDDMEKDLKVAQFNIDLLLLLKTKTHSNLNDEEEKLINNVLSDLQLKFIENKEV